MGYKNIKKKNANRTKQINACAFLEYSSHEKKQRNQ